MDRSVVLAVLFGALLAAPVARAGAPEPLKPVDASTFYRGTWLEIARRPMMLTNGCVAGTTTYAQRPDGKVEVLDACRRGAVDGKPAEIKGVGEIVDPGRNAKLRVRYNLLITWEYWVLDHADDGSWFISADPAFDKLWIYTRRPPSARELEALVARARALGYDTSKLEFPQPAPVAAVPAR